jgi:hypothetical protein
MSEAMTAEAAEVATGEVKPRHYGTVIIEWPAPHRKGMPLVTWRCAVLDAATGRPVTTVSKIAIPAVTADVSGWIECEMTMFADEDGMPVLFPEEHPGWPASCMTGVDGERTLRTGTFAFLVSEMRVAGTPEPQDSQGSGKQR